MKRIIALLLLLPVLVLSAMAVDVQSMIDALPAVNVLQTMDMEQQREAYDQTQSAYNAYMALSEEEKAALEGADAVFENLFGYFNTLVSPAEAVAEEPGTGANVLSTVIATAVGILLAQKIITKRKLKN
jgi:hypothetical protein